MYNENSTYSWYCSSSSFSLSLAKGSTIPTYSRWQIFQQVIWQVVSLGKALGWNPGYLCWSGWSVILTQPWSRWYSVEGLPKSSQNPPTTEDTMAPLKLQNISMPSFTVNHHKSVNIKEQLWTTSCMAYKAVYSGVVCLGIMWSLCDKSIWIVIDILKSRTCTW